MDFNDYPETMIRQKNKIIVYRREIRQKEYGSSEWVRIP